MSNIRNLFCLRQIVSEYGVTEENVTIVSRDLADATNVTHDASYSLDVVATTLEAVVAVESPSHAVIIFLLNYNRS